MKTNEEKTKAVFSRIKKEKDIYRKRRHTMVKAGLSMFSFCLVLVIGFSLWRAGAFSNLHGDNSYQIAENEKKFVIRREDYPIYGVKFPELVVMIPPTLEETIQKVDTFVYGEIVSDISYFTMSISTGYKGLDEKMGTENVFYEHTIKVLSDSNGLFPEGEQIKINANVIFEDLNMPLRKGSRYVIPVVQNTKHEKSYDFSVYGSYYVTPEGYVISAFDEEKLSTKIYSGLKVSELLLKLKRQVDNDVHKNAEAKTDGYYSEAEVAQDADLIVKVKRTEQEKNTVIGIGESNYHGWTISEVVIEKIEKNTLSTELSPGQIISVYESQFSVFDQKTKENLIWHVNHYQNMIPGNEYILYLKYSDADQWYFPLAVTLGKINLDPEEQVLDPWTKPSSDELRLMKKIQNEAIEKYEKGTGDH